LFFVVAREAAIVRAAAQLSHVRRLCRPDQCCFCSLPIPSLVEGCHWSVLRDTIMNEVSGLKRGWERSGHGAGVSFWPIALSVKRCKGRGEIASCSNAAKSHDCRQLCMRVCRCTGGRGSRAQRVARGPRTMPARTDEVVDSDGPLAASAGSEGGFNIPSISPQAPPWARKTSI